MWILTPLATFASRVVCLGHPYIHRLGAETVSSYKMPLQAAKGQIASTRDSSHPSSYPT